MTLTGLAIGAATLAAGLVVALAIRRLPTLRAQLAALAVVAVALPLVVVFVSGWAMFHMGDDVKILAVAVASASAALIGALLIARDVSRRVERLRGSAAALAAGDLGARAPVWRPAELAELGRSFNEMAEHLERLFDARRELVAWASHDLRTPITSMQAMLEALDDGLAPPDRYLPALREQVATLSRLVDDLFELARIDAGTLTVELEDAGVAPLVESCVRGLEAEARARRVRLESRADAGARARCEPAKVERVLLNLLTNALRHTPSDGAVVVRTERLAEEVRVTVEDTGDGLDDQAVHRMFERFWRAEPERSTPGAGLGLAIARGLVELQGGRIWAEPRAGGGARVSFTLPAT